MTDQEKVELLATKVMGWEYIKGYGFFKPGDGHMRQGFSWNPLHNIADAWMIVKQMAKAEPVTSHRFQFTLSSYCIYDITPERICEVALKVVEASAE